MKKIISTIIVACMMLSLFGGIAFISNAAVDPGKFTYVQLNGIQNWTSEDASSMNGFGATYAISSKGLKGNATQSIELTVTDTSKGRFCFASQAKSGSFSSKNPFAFTDTTKGYKLSDFDGIAIAFNDASGNPISFNSITGRFMRNQTDWNNYFQYEKSYTSPSSVYYNGYYYYSFDDYSNLLPTGVDDLSIISVLFYKALTIGEKAYISDIVAYSYDDDEQGGGEDTVDLTELTNAINTVSENDTEGNYSAELEAARGVLNNKKATQAQVDEQVKILRNIIRKDLPDAQFDKNNIVLSFGAVSDIHMNAGGTTKYERALDIIMKNAGGTIDAITVAGDFSASSYADGIVQGFKTATDAKLGANAKSFFVTGNHDAQGSDYASLSAFYTQLSSYLTIDLPSSDYTRGNRHAVINGYHFIGLNMMDYWNANEAHFEPEDLEWLAVELAAAREAAPGKPIFFYSHAPVFGTTYGSDLYTGTYWGSKNVYDYLKDYPEVVTFGGHVHFPLEDERTISQKDFTSLNCGSVEYMAIESGYIETSGTVLTGSDSHSISDGLLVQVDINNNIKVTRLDFSKDSVIKQPFYIPAPDMENETHLMYYDEQARTENNTAPVFSSNATISATKNGSVLELTFSTAKDDDLVHHYEFDIKGIPSGQVSSYKSYADFYYYPKASMIPDTITRKMQYSGVSTDTAFEITLYAVDSWGLKSEPIVFNSAVGEPTFEATPGPSLLNIDFVTGEPRNCSSMKGVTVVSDGDVETVNGKAAFACGKDKRATFSVPASIYSVTAKKFTAEAAFTVGKLGTEQTIFSCNKDAKGYYIFINEDGKIGFTMHNSSGPITVLSKTAVAEGEYHDVIANLLSGTLTLYIDGVSVGTAAVSGNSSYNTNVGFTVGARAASGGGYTSFFTGYVYQAGVSNSNYTAETALARHNTYLAGKDYKNLEKLYAEREYAFALLYANMQAITQSIEKVIGGYISELSAAISALPVNATYVDAVIRTDEVKLSLTSLAGITELGEPLPAPVVTGVVDGAVYDLADGPVVPQWDASTYAELDFESVSSGTSVTEVGKHQLIVLNGEKDVIIKFEVIDSTVEPVVNFDDGAEFDLYTDPAPAATWTPEEATATLNGEAYTAGTTVSEVGEYTLVVTNGTKSVTVTFTVVDTTPDTAPGDLDGDGEITVTDALTVLRFAAKLAVPTDPEMILADVDYDGEVTVTDALAILRVAAKLADASSLNKIK